MRVASDSDQGRHALLMLTDVTAVFRDFGTARAAPIARLTPGDGRSPFPAARIDGPQSRRSLAICAQRGGKLASIGRLGNAVAIT